MVGRTTTRDTGSTQRIASGLVSVGIITYLIKTPIANPNAITSHIEKASAFSFSNASPGSKGSIFRLFTSSFFDSLPLGRFLPEYALARRAESTSTTNVRSPAIHQGYGRHRLILKTRNKQ